MGDYRMSAARLVQLSSHPTRSPLFVETVRPWHSDKHNGTSERVDRTRTENKCEPFPGQNWDCLADQASLLRLPRKGVRAYQVIPFIASFEARVTAYS
jgi:hypothetical protein